MKLIEIDEAGDKLVLRPKDSTVARVVNKTDASDVHAALLDILEEAPEQRSTEPESASDEDEVEADGSEDPIAGAQEIVNEALGFARDMLKTPEGQKVKSRLESVFPKTRRMKKNSA